MRANLSPRRLFIQFVNSLLLVVLFAVAVPSQSLTTRSTVKSAQTSAEQMTARYFESIRKSPTQQLAFLLEMPKGGDLHNHLSGSIYAESYVQWAAEKGLCVNNKTFALSQPPCDANAGQSPAASALTNPLLYREMINAWSMRFWQYSG